MTPDSNHTGNPVFDYRAGFRAFADRLQWRLLYSGLALGALAAALWLGGQSGVVCAIAGAAGAGLFALGLWWAFYWRRKIRDEFRRKYGE